MIARAPVAPIEPPAAVARIAGRRPTVAVWQNELGGLTFRVGDELYVKWNPRGNAIDLAAEAERLAWAAELVTVPRVLDVGGDDAGTWLVTRPVPGTNAVTERWRGAPETAVRALGIGLRRLHDTLPVSSCPFSWMAASRVAVADQRLRGGLIDEGRLGDEHGIETTHRALVALHDVPGVDRLVVCHGDACAPNTLLADDGSVSGHVDLGTLGIADRWADLAVATWSTVWNYGPGWEELLLESYGIEPDETRTAYYRLLWDLGP